MVGLRVRVCPELSIWVLNPVSTLAIRPDSDQCNTGISEWIHTGVAEIRICSLI